MARRIFGARTKVLIAEARRRDEERRAETLRSAEDLGYIQRRPRIIQPKAEVRCAVYFAATACGARVKIGYSYNPAERLRGIQAESERLFGQSSLPVRFVLMLDRPSEYETEMHAKFSPLRDRGEWFRFDSEIKLFIAEHFGLHRPPEYFC